MLHKRVSKRSGAAAIVLIAILAAVRRRTALVTAVTMALAAVATELVPRRSALRSRKSLSSISAAAPTRTLAPTLMDLCFATMTQLLMRYVPAPTTTYAVAF